MTAQILMYSQFRAYPNVTCHRVYSTLTHSQKASVSVTGQSFMIRIRRHRHTSWLTITLLSIHYTVYRRRRFSLWVRFIQTVSGWVTHSLAHSLTHPLGWVTATQSSSQSLTTQSQSLSQMSQCHCEWRTRRQVPLLVLTNYQVTHSHSYTSLHYLVST